MRASISFVPFFRQVAALMLVLFLAAVTYAQITPSDDAYVNSAASTTNYGAAVTLDLSSAADTAFIRFDLTPVPASYTGASIAKATLKLYVNSVTTAGSFNVDYVTGTWAEKTIKYSNEPTIGTTIAASVPLVAANVHDYILIDITSSVQAWLNGTEPNDGIALVANSPLVATFDSKENTAASHAPEIDIVYAGIAGVATASGSGLTGGGTSGTLNLSLTNTCAANQVLQWNGTAWICAAVSTGTITGVTAGTDLTGGGTSGNVTLNLNTAATNALYAQLAASNTFTGAQTINNNVTITAANTTLFASGGTTGVSGTGSTYGVYGLGSYGVLGHGGNYGVYGEGTNGVYGYGSSYGVYGYGPYGVVGNGTGSSSTGVYASGSAYGVAGYGGPYGVYGLGSTYGMYGYSNGSNSYGVYGNGPGSGSTGVYGTGSMYGVVGNGSDWGVVGNGPDNSTGALGAGTDGVYGYSSTYGVYGIGTDIGVLGSTNYQSGTVGVYGDAANAPSSWGVYSYGNFGATGSKSAVVALPDDRVVALYTVESPENWFEDFGTGQLKEGVATVEFERTFALTVSPAAGYHVFLTPKGDCEGLYVGQETATGFQVRELHGGRSNVVFDYRIVAKRKGLESVRLEEVSADHEIAEGIRQFIATRASNTPRLRHPTKPPENAALNELRKPEPPKPPQQPPLPAPTRTGPPVPPQRVAAPEPSK